MNQKDDKANADESPKGAPPRRFESTLPQGKKNAAGESAAGEHDLDLDLGDIQSRLPYGSEDIADK